MYSLTALSAPDGQAGTKRRRVRKGTFSCWECKRRKMRCILDPPNHVCKSCRRRGSKCISQEFPEEGPLSIGETTYNTGSSTLKHRSAHIAFPAASPSEERRILTPESINSESSRYTTTCRSPEVCIKFSISSPYQSHARQVQLLRTACIEYRHPYLYALQV